MYRRWIFPLERHSAVQDCLTKVEGVRVNVNGLPAIVFDLVKVAAAHADETARYERALATPRFQGDETLDLRMMPFQREGVKFALRHGGRVLIGDEMGEWFELFLNDAVGSRPGGGCSSATKRVRIPAAL